MDFAGLYQGLKYQGLKYFKVQPAHRGIEFDNKQITIFGVPVFNQTAAAPTRGFVLKSIEPKATGDPMRNRRPNFLGPMLQVIREAQRKLHCLKEKTKLFTAYVCQSKVMSLIANGDVIDVRTGVTSLNRTPLLFPYKRSPGTEPQGG